MLYENMPQKMIIFLFLNVECLFTESVGRNP